MEPSRSPPEAPRAPLPAESRLTAFRRRADVTLAVRQLASTPRASTMAPLVLIPGGLCSWSLNFLGVRLSSAGDSISFVAYAGKFSTCDFKPHTFMQLEIVRWLATAIGPNEVSRETQSEDSVINSPTSAV